MRRIYTFLATAILLMVGATSVSAKDYYIPETDPLDEITADQIVVLKGVYANAYLASKTLSSVVTEDCFYKFIAGEDKNGYKTWYIQQVSTGQYVSQAAGGLTSDVTKATNYYVERAVAYEGEVPAEAWIDGTLTDIHGTLLDSEGAFVFTNVADEETHMNLYEPNGGLCFFTYDDTNATFVYRVSKAEGLEKLRCVMDDLFPNDKPVEETFTEGTQFGQVPSTYYQALVAARQAADDLLYNSTNPDAAACEAAAEALEEAFAAAQAHMVKIEPGYYRFKTTYYNKENGYAYTDGTDIMWAQNTPYNPPATLTTDDAAYIWHITFDENNPEAYQIRNVRYNKYISFYDVLGASQKMVDEPADAWVIEPHPTVTGAFVFRSTENMNQGLHAATSGSFVVRYSYTTDASAWAIESVDAATVEAIQGDVDQALLNDQLAAALQEAFDTREQGYERKSITLTAEQLWSNAQEPTEGPIENLIDTVEGQDGEVLPNYSTMFHTAWSTSVDVPYHNLVVNLGEAVDAVRFNLATRVVGTYNRPTVVDIYAAKQLAETDSVAGDSWTKIGQYTVTYNHSFLYNGEEKANFLAQLNVPLGDKYQYIRMDVVDARMASGTKTTYFNLSDLRAFGDVDAENSINTSIPAEYTQPLDEAITTAMAELAAGNATQATIDALEEALKLYSDNYPDPDVLRDLLAEVKSLAEGISYNASAPETPGYFAQGVGEEMTARVEAVEEQMPEGQMLSFLQVGTLTASLKAIMADIHEAMNKPADGFYRIVSMSTSDDRKGNLVYPAGSNDAKLWWSGSRDDANMPSDLSYIWQLTNNGDGTVTLRNLFSGYYMGQVKGDDVSVQVGMSKEAANIPLEFSGTAGALNIVQDENRYLNTDPAGQIVTWLERGDNSLFRFASEAENPWEGAHFVAGEANVPSIHVLPFEVSSTLMLGQAYEVLGFNAENGTLELIEPENDVFEAGVPFVAVIDDESEGFFVLPTAGGSCDIADMAEADYTDRVLNGQNGLIGVFAPDTVTTRELRFSSLNGENFVVYQDANTIIAANSGYLTLKTLPNTTETGDLSVKFSENVLTGVTNVVVNTPARKEAIFDLSGRRVQKAQKGLYIINGKKVLVK